MSYVLTNFTTIYSPDLGLARQDAHPFHVLNILQANNPPPSSLSSGINVLFKSSSFLFLTYFSVHILPKRNRRKGQQGKGQTRKSSPNWMDSCALGTFLYLIFSDFTGKINHLEFERRGGFCYKKKSIRRWDASNN